MDPHVTAQIKMGMHREVCMPKSKTVPPKVRGIATVVSGRSALYNAPTVPIRPLRSPPVKNLARLLARFREQPLLAHERERAIEEPHGGPHVDRVEAQRRQHLVEGESTMADTPRMPSKCEAGVARANG